MSALLSRDAALRIAGRVRDKGGNAPSLESSSDLSDYLPTTQEWASLDEPARAERRWMFGLPSYWAPTAPNKATSEEHKVFVWADQLSSDVSWAYTVWSQHSDWTSDSRSKRRVIALEIARARAMRLRDVIEDPELPLRDSIERHASGAFRSMAEFLACLRQVEAAAEAEVARLRSTFPFEGDETTASFADAAPLSALDGNSQSAGVAFIGEMCRAYERAFGAEVKVTYEDDNDREPTGPFVYFVLECMRETAIADAQAGNPPRLPMANSAVAVAKAYQRHKAAAGPR